MKLFFLSVFLLLPFLSRSAPLPEGKTLPRIRVPFTEEKVSLRDTPESPVWKKAARLHLEKAADGMQKHSLWNECVNGVDDKNRVWWVQAETVLGFLNAWQKEPERTEYKQAAEDVLDYIREKVVDPRPGSEWFWLLDDNGEPVKEKPIVEPWKCPYHNGRMCFEIIRRNAE